MTILAIIKQCEIRMSFLNALKNSNIELENYDLVNKIDAEILELQDTIDKLKNIAKDIGIIRTKDE